MMAFIIFYIVLLLNKHEIRFFLCYCNKHQSGFGPHFFNNYKKYCFKTLLSHLAFQVTKTKKKNKEKACFYLLGFDLTAHHSVTTL